MQNILHQQVKVAEQYRSTSKNRSSLATFACSIIGTFYTLYLKLQIYHIS